MERGSGRWQKNGPQAARSELGGVPTALTSVRAEEEVTPHAQQHQQVTLLIQSELIGVADQRLASAFLSLSKPSIHWFLQTQLTLWRNAQNSALPSGAQYKLVSEHPPGFHGTARPGSDTNSCWLQPPSSDHGASGLEDAAAGGSKEQDRLDKPRKPQAPGTFLLQQSELCCKNCAVKISFTCSCIQKTLFWRVQGFFLL